MPMQNIRYSEGFMHCTTALSPLYVLTRDPLNSRGPRMDQPVDLVEGEGLMTELHDHIYNKLTNNSDV